MRLHFIVHTYTNIYAMQKRLFSEQNGQQQEQAENSDQIEVLGAKITERTRS